MHEWRTIVQSHYWSKSVGYISRRNNFNNTLLHVCSIIICLLTWALDIVLSFEIHAISLQKQKKKFLSAVYYQPVSTWNTNIITSVTDVYYYEVNT